MALTVTLPASDRRNRTRTPRATRDTFTRSSFGTTVSRTSNTDNGGACRCANGCSLSGGGGGGGGGVAGRVGTVTVPDIVSVQLHTNV